MKMNHQPVPAAVPPKTKLYDLYYNGKVERMNLTCGMAHAIKRQLINTGRYQGTKFEVKAK